MARALRGNHKAINVAAWFDQVEMNIEAMGKGNRSARADVVSDILRINIALKLIRGQHHDNITPGGSFSHIHNLETSISSLGAAG